MSHIGSYEGKGLSSAVMRRGKLTQEAEMPDDVGEIVPDEDFALWVLVAQTKDAILRARQTEYVRFGISNERRTVLWIIQSYGGRATPVEIARRFFRELQSITEMLKRMEKADLVSRHRGSGRSKTEYRLTDKGVGILQQSLRNEVDKRIFSVLTHEEREQLAASLWKLRTRALEELGVRDMELSVPYAIAKGDRDVPGTHKPLDAGNTEAGPHHRKGEES
jgi:DNA-binding MarR family transcriptional regulator